MQNVCGLIGVRGNLAVLDILMQWKENGKY
jgi:hypothetical protein